MPCRTGPLRYADTDVLPSSNRGRARSRLREFLLGRFCLDCGESDPVVLEFDHVRPPKICAVSRMVSNGSTWADIAAEIAKCELVCVNCHRIRTATTHNWYANQARQHLYAQIGKVLAGKWCPCGEGDQRVLEFDHVRGEKIESISQLINRGRAWGTIRSEIKKCQILCANCHRRKTARERNWHI